MEQDGCGCGVISRGCNRLGLRCHCDDIGAPSMGASSLHLGRCERFLISSGSLRNNMIRPIAGTQRSTVPSGIRSFSWTP
eukprot:3597334-Pyramimonas_sp.AAC.1